MERNSPPPVTEFDQITTSNSILMLKSLIPFLDFPIQKGFSIMIRIQELQQTLSYFNAPFHQSSSLSMNHKDATSEDILNSIMCYCPQKNLDMIKQMRNIMQMTNVFKMYGDMEQNPDFQNIFNTMNSMNNADINNDKPPTESSNNNQDTNPASDTPVSNDTLSNFMNSEQKRKYEEYLEQLENIDI